jgi:glycosyltransferase involved in cell wall biosynthesis
MPSVLFFSVMNGAAWGGSEELWYQSALWTARQGYPVAVCCFDWREKAGRLKELEKAGCRLYLLPGKEETRHRPLFRNSKLRAKLAEIPFEQYDKVILNQGGWKDLVHGPVKKLVTRLKDYCIIYHNYNANEKLTGTRAALLQQWVNGAAKNIGATLEIFRTMEGVYKLTVPRQEKLFNPLTIPIPGSATPFPPTKEGKYCFAVLAALDIERKAQDLLIKCLAHPDWKERNWELHLYGEGKDRTLLQTLVTTLQLQAKVFIHGNAPDYVEAIRQTHLVLQITKIDAMPISVLEAMAMARPLVVSPVGDMPLWVKEDRNGWVTDAVSVEAIHQALEKAWQHRADWEKMGERSYAIFKEEYPASPVEYFLQLSGIVS